MFARINHAAAAREAGLKLTDELGPSHDLRRWFGHRPERWEEFRLRYRAELKQPEQRRHLQELLVLAHQGSLILLYGARDTTHNQAVVIREVLKNLAE